MFTDYTFILPAFSSNIAGNLTNVPGDEELDQPQTRLNEPPNGVLSEDPRVFPLLPPQSSPPQSSPPQSSPPQSSPPQSSPPQSSPPQSSPNGPPGPITSLEDGNTQNNGGITTTIPESATATDLLSSDPPHNNIWQEHENKFHGFTMMYPSDWTFTNSTIAPSTEPYVAAQFCPTEPGFLGVSSQCQTSIEGQTKDQIWVKIYPSLTMHYQFSGDNATKLVEQFMHQEMNRSSTASGWQSYDVINRTTTMINATDVSSITQTRIVSIPAIIVDYRHSQGANDFRNVELYTMFAGKGYVIQYLPRTNIELTGDNVQENAQGFYPPIIEDIFMTFSPMRSVQ
jgi:hypothetical protein